MRRKKVALALAFRVKNREWCVEDILLEVRFHTWTEQNLFCVVYIPQGCLYLQQEFCEKDKIWWLNYVFIPLYLYHKMHRNLKQSWSELGVHFWIKEALTYLQKAIWTVSVEAGRRLSAIWESSFAQVLSVFLQAQCKVWTHS